MDLNTEECRHKEAEKKQKSRGKQMAENPQECRKKNANSKEKWRVKGKSDERKALIRFQNATRHGPIFICSCCYTRQFQENSLKLEKVKKKINTEIFRKCIPEGQEVIVKTCVNNISTAECYICKTCNRHMQKGKMPPECRQNNMQIDPQPEIMKLTELENSLIARNILFEKMYMLPTSRYTATTGKIINVPVPEGSVLNTINSLPRTPYEAGLIGVELKLKLNFKNTHHKGQLVDVSKIYTAINHLKKAGNPYYQFYDDCQTYEERCVNNDEDHLVASNLHGDEGPTEPPTAASPKPEDEVLTEAEKEQEEDNKMMEEEQEYRNKDPVKKYHFNYDKSIGMSNMHPEVTEKDTNQKKEPNMVLVAPAEGSTPLDIMFDKDWDIKSYPHIHQANGSNGLDQEREVKLTTQRYFVNRINHKEQQFRKCAPYLYAAVSHTGKNS